MTASTISGDVRAVLKTALTNVTANVYDHVPEAPQVPFAVIVPVDPYMEIVTIGNSKMRVKLNFVVSAGVAYNSNPGSLDNLEKLALQILAAMPAGWEVGDVSRPSVTQVGASNLLVADITASTYYEQTI
jgi:hypothetical protein